VLVPALTLYVLISVGWLIGGVRSGSAGGLLGLTLFWWLSALVAGYFTGVAFLERGYSENWALIGFIFISGPIILVTGVLSIIELVVIRRWSGKGARAVRIAAGLLLIFLVVQVALGLAAG
jgi:hypothetical protein